MASTSTPGAIIILIVVEVPRLDLAARLLWWEDDRLEADELEREDGVLGVGEDEMLGASEDGVDGVLLGEDGIDEVDGLVPDRKDKD